MAKMRYVVMFRWHVGEPEGWQVAAVAKTLKRAEDRVQYGKSMTTLDTIEYRIEPVEYLK